MLGASLHPFVVVFAAAFFAVGFPTWLWRWRLVTVEKEDEKNLMKMGLS